MNEISLEIFILDFVKGAMDPSSVWAYEMVTNGRGDDEDEDEDVDIVEGLRLPPSFFLQSFFAVLCSQRARAAIS